VIIFEDEDMNDDWITTIGQMRKMTEDAVTWKFKIWKRKISEADNFQDQT
jgi:hypothetical protein